MAELRIKELYRSIQGESTFAGWPCVFVRTAGCDIRCVYCDEAHAFGGGERLTLDEILERVSKLGTRLVEVTGGEPLAQKATPELVRRLCDAGYEVLIETGGHHDISVLDSRAHAIVDVKTPGSQMSQHNDLENLARLRPGDEVKFVLCDRADYDFAVRVIREHELESRVPVHFSPVHPGLDPKELVSWMLADGLRVRLNLQLHKYVWGPDAKSV
ncbi:MAG TPA: 7-carboxy-7-deazaguanine synthase QueE [Myxococcota bacterium]|nr:7-carboxy-7-deazaguanine synthase QueE [Myxococcota bacterium]